MEVCREITACADADGARLTSRERHALIVGYKDAVGRRRRALEALREAAAAEQRRNGGGAGEMRVMEARAYAERVRRELVDLCDEIDRTVDRRLRVEGEAEADETSRADATEARVLYLKMRGDYRRYVAEALDYSRADDDVFEARERAARAYEQAHKAAMELPKTNPLRLGLALNRAVFHHDICDDVDVAVSIAKAAHDDALEEFPFVRDESARREAAVVMRLLRANVRIWTEDVGNDDAMIVGDAIDNDRTFSDESEMIA